jgi:hypothetical protein
MQKVLVNKVTKRTQYGVFEPGLNSELPPDFRDIKIEETPLTDKQAIELIAKHAGEEEAKRAISRYTQGEKSMVRYVRTPASLGDSNWAGYIITHSNVSGVYGKFIVTNNASGHVAAWTGIGGFGSSSTLAQTGVSFLEKKAWTELLPDYAVFRFSVNVGDKISSSVNYDYDYYKWFLYVADLTTGVYYAGLYSYSLTNTCAEWVIEYVGTAPSSVNTVSFSQCIWTAGYGGAHQDINSDGSTALYRTKFANFNYPSAISSGQDFTVPA